MARQPQRQINIEVVMTILGVSRRDIGQWTSNPVKDKHEHFHENDAYKPCRLMKAAHIAEYRNGQNAKSEQQPNGCMEKFD